MKTNPVQLEIYKNRFSSIAEEMGVTLNRTGFSPNIKERRDFSCAIFDGKGEMIAQAAHIPVHTGSMPLSVISAIESVAMEEGDMVMLNDPFKGGTHLPDITLVAPLFSGDEKPEYYVANRAHHADVGGISPGSMPLATSIYQEGIIIPPVKICRKGVIDDSLMRFLLNNVRTPLEREGDFAAQIMANRIGIQRLKDLIETNSIQDCRIYGKGLIDYSEKIMRKVIGEIPDGEYSFEDFLDDDGIKEKKVAVSVKLVVNGDEATLDFSESSSQVVGSVNAVKAITLSCVLYAFRCLVKDDIMTNAGCAKPINVVTKKDTIVDASFPSSVAGGNVETSQRIVDVVFGALSKALPGKIPAASQGTMNSISIGGIDQRNNNMPFAYYETLGGGMGASLMGPGESAIHSHMTNTMNTPIEALEYSFPFQATEYSVRKGSGGKGRFPGGDGIVREIMLTSEAEVTVLSERRTGRPYGLSGGRKGMQGRNTVIRDGRRLSRPGKFFERMNKGDIIRIETPGGGGYGRERKNNE